MPDCYMWQGFCSHHDAIPPYQAGQARRDVSGIKGSAICVTNAWATTEGVSSIRGADGL